MMTPYALYGLLEAEKAGYPIPNGQAVDRGLVRLKQYLEQMKPAWDRLGPVLAGPPGGARGSSPASQVNDSLYLLYVMSQREPLLGEWWMRIEKAAGSPEVSDYGHALALEMAVKAGEKKLAGKLAAELRKRAKRGGAGVYWTTAGFSRWGDNQFEVTAAAFKALVAHDPNDPLIPDVLHFFQVTKQGDRWVSTKDTAMILYALCDYLTAVRDDRFLPGGKLTGVARLAVNGAAPVEVKFDGPLSKTVALPGKELKTGENMIAVRSADASGSLVRVVVRFTRGGAADIPARDFGVTVVRTVSVREKNGAWRALESGAVVPKGSYVKVGVTGTTSNGQALTFTLLESPKPASGEVLPQDDRRPVNVPPGGYNLREDREAKVCFHYEAPQGAVSGEYVFLAEFAGEFRLPPARVEPMYRPSQGGNSDSFVLKVTTK
jgi:uncharacterized protein YfaS (alpha-2-macroglobulin family)